MTSQPFIPVLLYHAFGDAPRPRLRDFTLSDREFERHVEVLRAYVEGGAHPMLIKDMAAALRGTQPLPERAFAVTFDDGYDDNLRAIEMLAEARIPSTLYVTSGFVGREDILTPAQLRQLAEHPLVDIGAHSVSHPRLDELSRTEIERELRDGRAMLRDLTGTDVSSVAYPHGAHDRRVLDEARRAGYTSGVAVKNELSRPGDDPMAIARWTVLAHHTIGDLQKVMDGNWPVVGSSDRLRTRGFRVIRRTHRTVIRAVSGSG